MTLKCERFERAINNYNCGRFKKLCLRILADWRRRRHVRSKVKVHRRPDGGLALLHGRASWRVTRRKES
jgi:hypothetical protein